MSTLSLVKPLENIDDSAEANVLAIINHLMPTLDDWRKGEDLRNDLSDLEQVIKAKEKEFDEYQTKKNNAKEQLSHIYKELKNYSYVSIGCTLFSLILLFSNSILGIGLFLVGLVIGIQSITKIRKTIEQQITACEIDIARINSELESTKLLKLQIENEMNVRSDGFPELRIGNVRFGLEFEEVAEKNILLDVSGVHSETELKAVDVSEIQEGLSGISDEVKSLLIIPPLLSKNDESIEDPINQLFGEENDLQKLVGEFTVNLGKLKDFSLKLPMIKSSNILVHRILAEEFNKIDDDNAIIFSGEKKSNKEIKEFVKQLSDNQNDVISVFAELNDVYQDLENACNLYSDARTTSINIIHNNLIEVLNRSAWCSRRFYCPRTIVSPAYLEDLIGVNPKNAFLLSLDDLLIKLSSDEQISKRLNDQPDLQKQLIDAYYSVQDFSMDLTFDENGNRANQITRPRHIEDQLKESLKRFNNVLSKIMTGSTYPVLNFSSESQLYFNPDDDEWFSDLIPYKYSTPDILKYGGVVKAHSDLMIPLWEHLWTEKADFRKSELFRTNESMIRMSEKESEKLIEIGNQFRADMRTVREHVYHIESDLQSKHMELVSFRDGMDMLGLLSDRSKESVTDEKIMTMLVGESSLPKMERYETLLGGLPISEAEARGAVYDPIDIIKEPDSLVSYQVNANYKQLPI